MKFLEKKPSFQRVNIEELRAKREAQKLLEDLYEKFSHEVNATLDKQIADIMRSYGVSIPNEATEQELEACLKTFENKTGKTIEVILDRGSDEFTARIYLNDVEPYKTLVFKPTLKD